MFIVKETRNESVKLKPSCSRVEKNTPEVKESRCRCLKNTRGVVNFVLSRVEFEKKHEGAKVSVPPLQKWQVKNQGKELAPSGLISPFKFRQPQQVQPGPSNLVWFYEVALSSKWPHFNTESFNN